MACSHSVPQSNYCHALTHLFPELKKCQRTAQPVPRLGPGWVSSGCSLSEGRRVMLVVACWQFGRQKQTTMGSVQRSKAAYHANTAHAFLVAPVRLPVRRQHAPAPGVQRCGCSVPYCHGALAPVPWSTSVSRLRVEWEGWGRKVCVGQCVLATHNCMQGDDDIRVGQQVSLVAAPASPHHQSCGACTPGFPGLSGVLSAL